ncbi:MAG: adenosylhomocysteinase [Oscillospiraceae bacterium]|jgi:adenosylhomocysteinase|nr:adenosylhomocysteinase [Oscillospiraceae bacterium]
MSDIRNASLAPSGAVKLAWARRNMPLLNAIEQDFAKTQPFRGLRIAVSVHLEAKTAILAQVMAAGGADLRVTGSNPLSTQDDVAAALSASGIDVYAYHGATADEYARHIGDVLDFAPNIIIDDGGDLVTRLHTDFAANLPEVIGGCEETTTGILRLRAMERDGALKFPMIAVNNAKCKHLFDNRYGTGQSVWDAILRTTNLNIAGKTVVVAGYGWCGKGVAMRADGLGARVIVTEVDPVAAIEAIMDGYAVMPMDDAAALGDFFITVTSVKQVITTRHFDKLRDGAILTNAGHFNVEVDMDALEQYAVSKYEARHNIAGYILPNGRHVFVIGEGRLVNLAAGDGHPADIMDMSFAVQALAARHLAENRGTLKAGVIAFPDALDNEIARRKLAAIGVGIDSLTAEQREYLGSWKL